MSIRITFGNIELTQFSPKDTRELYSIRNHPTVRQFMFRPAMIPYCSHCGWAKRELTEGTNILLLLVRMKPGTRAVGFTQLRINDGSAEIGVMFREAQNHRFVIPVVTMATLELTFNILQLQSLVSYVLPTHSAALRLNKGFGAWEEQSDRPGMMKLRLTRDACLQNTNFAKLRDRVGDRLVVATGGTPAAPR